MRLRDRPPDDEIIRTFGDRATWRHDPLLIANRPARRSNHARLSVRALEERATPTLNVQSILAIGSGAGMDATVKVYNTNGVLIDTFKPYPLPGGTFVHLTRYGISPRGEGSVDHGGLEGENSTGKTGWTPPCPPKGDDAHRYVWSVYALREPSGLKAGAKPGEVAGALKDAPVLASGTITARYRR